MTTVRMARRVLLPLTFVAAALAAQAGAAIACNCPKEQLIKEYGTVSQVRQPQVPLPPPLPVSKVSAPVGG